jgi:multiple sugar transport system substrate-binding protein
MKREDRLIRSSKRPNCSTWWLSSRTSSTNCPFGGSYLAAQSIPPLQVLAEPLKACRRPAHPRAWRPDLHGHGEPQAPVRADRRRRHHQRAFSIDRLHQEGLRNAERKHSAYDLIAVDLPWLGEFVTKGVISPLPDVMDTDRLDPGDFHTAGWRAMHWDGVPYGVPSQTTPELMFYRKDWFAKDGIAPPATTDDVIAAAKHFHDPRMGRYGVAWNAARGTALGHTFIMTCADFGQPIIDLPEMAGGYAADRLGNMDYVPRLNTDRALAAADYLMRLMEYSPPDILSMSWFERVRPYAAGKVAMAYGYTLLAPYFELDATSAAHGNTGYLPHPHGPEGVPVAPVGGYALCIPANLEEDRVADVVEALVAFTSPGAQKLYVQNGSRTAPRYSVGADPEVRRLSTIFETVDQMSWRDELQFWPRPPIPQISEIIDLCGTELHDMLRGLLTPRDALDRIQAAAEELLRKPVH